MINLRTLVVILGTATWVLWDVVFPPRGGGGSGSGGRSDAPPRQRSTKQQQQQPTTENEAENNRPPKKKKQRAKLVALLGPHAAEIPCDELAPLARIAQAVFGARGWRGGRYIVTAAWARACAAASSASGGGWPDDVEAADVTDARLARLADAIDAELLGGALQRLVTAEGARDNTSSNGGADGGGIDDKANSLRLHYKAVDAPEAPWLACFDATSGCVRVNAPRVANKPVSRATPVNCEGVVCTTRLQMLAHSLAHELVHAIVRFAAPDLDARGASYLPKERHGPAFAALNAALFGHTSTALARCDARAALGGGW